MHIRLALLLSMLATCALGCVPGVPHNAKTVIAEDAKCPEEEMRFKLYGDIANGDGCGRRVQAVLTCPYGESRKSKKCVWRLVNELKEQRLRSRAAADFQCASDLLHVSPIDSLAWSIQGCEQAATYIWTCPTRTSTTDSQYGYSTSSYVPSYADDCTWVMNSSR